MPIGDIQLRGNQGPVDLLKCQLLLLSSRALFTNRSQVQLFHNGVQELYSRLIDRHHRLGASVIGSGGRSR